METKLLKWYVKDDIVNVPTGDKSILSNTAIRKSLPWNYSCLHFDSFELLFTT